MAYVAGQIQRQTILYFILRIPFAPASQFHLCHPLGNPFSPLKIEKNCHVNLEIFPKIAPTKNCLENGILSSKLSFMTRTRQLSPQNVFLPKGEKLPKPHTNCLFSKFLVYDHECSSPNKMFPEIFSKIQGRLQNFALKITNSCLNQNSSLNVDFFPSDRQIVENVLQSPLIPTLESHLLPMASKPYLFTFL